MLARPLAAERREKRRPFGRRATFAAALSAGADRDPAGAGTLIAVRAGSAFETVMFTSTSGRAIRVAAVVPFGAAAAPSSCSCLPWHCYWLPPARLVDSMEHGAPTVKRWGGRLLVVVGTWFVALGVFAEIFADTFPL
jgi:hypothetical protein